MDAVGVGALNVDMLYEVRSLAIGGMEFRPGGEIFGDQRTFSETLSALEKQGKLIDKYGGGSAANTMVAMSKLGFKTGVLGKAGSDVLGDFLLSELGEVDHHRVKRGGATGICISLLTEGERSLLVLPNANNEFTYDESDARLLNESRIAHLTSFKDRKGLETQIQLLGQLNEGIMVSVDPGEIYARMGIETIRPLLERADVLFPSEREVEMLTGEDPLKGGRKLMELGPRLVVCTMGAEGSLVITPKREYRVDAIEVEVMDKTGAGDVYAAGFLSGMLKGWSPQRCGEFAALASGISISRYGRDGYPDVTLLERYERGEI
jgi:ribokinase